MKPKAYDNNWLGICGVTGAALTDDKGNTYGYCLDTPNCIAYAMATDDRITKAVGRFDTTRREDVQDRFWFVVKDAEIHEKNITR